MNRTFCDICNKEMGYKSDNIGNTRQMDMIIDGIYYSDVCANCKREIKKYIKKIKTELWVAHE